MKMKNKLLGVCLAGVTLLSAVPTFGAYGTPVSMGTTIKSGRVPSKPMYTGATRKYSESCIAEEFWCHNFNCPSVWVEAQDFLILPDGRFLGDKPSYLKNEKELEVRYFLQNQIPFTLPVGKISLNEILGESVFENIELEVKEGVNVYMVKVGGELITTAPVKGVQGISDTSNYKDLNKNHWAYGNIEKALREGWIKPKTNTEFGVATYENIKSPVTGMVSKERVDNVTVMEVITGINGVLMSNNIYMGDNFSRTDLKEFYNTSESFGTKDSINKMMSLSGVNSEYADWLNVSMSAAVSLEDYTALSYFDSLASMSGGDDIMVDRHVVAELVHNIVYDMNLPVVNKMEGSEYSYYDDTSIRDNYIVGSAGYRTGSTHYTISRGILSPEKVNGKYVGFSGEPVGKPELATILCNLDRAIKAAKTAK